MSLLLLPAVPAPAPPPESASSANKLKSSRGLGFSRAYRALSSDQSQPHFFDVETIYAECHLFRNCSREFVRTLIQSGDAACLRGKMYDSGQLVLEQGKVGKNLYVIHRGECEVIVDDKQTKKLEAGQCFGEINLLGLSPFATATIRTTTMSHLFLVAATVFTETLRMYPRERHIFERAAADRYKELLQLQSTSRKKQLVKDSRVLGLTSLEESANGHTSLPWSLRSSMLSQVNESYVDERRNAISTPPHGPAIPNCELETCAQKVARSISTDSKRGFKVHGKAKSTKPCSDEDLDEQNIDVSRLPPIQVLSSAQKLGLLSELRRQARLKLPQIHASRSSLGSSSQY